MRCLGCAFLVAALAVVGHAADTAKADKWTARYFKAAGFDPTPEQSRSVSRRMDLVARRCDARHREIGILWALAYSSYRSRHERSQPYWRKDEPPSVSPVRFVVLFNLVIADAHDANGGVPMSRTACLDVLAELAENPDQFELSVGHLADHIDAED